MNPLIRALDDPNGKVKMMTGFYLREAFKKRYDPETRRAETVVDKNELDIEVLPKKIRSRSRPNSRLH